MVPREKENIKQMVDRIIQDGEITRAEQALLNAGILKDGDVSKEEKEQIERLWKLIRSGEIKAVS